MRLRGDTPILPEWTGTAWGDVSTRTELQTAEQLDTPVTFETLLSMPFSLDVSTPLMWGGTSRLDAPVSLELTGLIREDIWTQAELAAGSTVVGNAATPAEWLIAAFGDTGCARREPPGRAR
jgi:hypothetical protein